MQNNLVFNGQKINFQGYDNTTNTLTIKDTDGAVYHLTFEDENQNGMTISLINSNVSVIEFFKGNIEKADFIINIDEKSSLKRFSIMVENNKDLTVNREVNNHGKYQSMQLDLTPSSTESNENVNFVSKEAEGEVIDGIYASGKGNKKYNTNLNHIAMQTSSDVHIFAVNDDEAKVFINTDGFIKNGASQTNCTQEGRIINLTDRCFGNVLPNLHIDENDVQAAHSCSVGSVNTDHLYYLETRGLSELEARNILIRGYFNPLLKNIDDEGILNEIQSVLDKRIG